MSARETAGTERDSRESEAPRDEKRTRNQAEATGTEFRQRLDQVGAILAKGLDLAEAGVGLGVTIISRVGTAATQKIREGMDGAAVANPPPSEPDAVTEPEPAYGITNRLPLTPGGSVKISFSVNNESMTEPKKVELRVEGFAGDAQGGHLDASGFSVKPSTKTIGPVDFEKFVLQCSVPSTAQPDVYRGAIVVTSENELRIPVVLVVMPL
jgi:hypothetical protein